MTGPWWTRAKVGDKVVCIDRSRKRSETTYSVFKWLFWRKIRIGSVYTICGVDHLSSHSLDGCHIYLYLQEMPANVRYSAMYFKPVRKAGTAYGMSILRKALDTKPVKEDV